MNREYRWAKAYAGAKQKPKIHVCVGEGINMRALCRKSTLLSPIEIPPSMLKRMDKDDFCVHCLKLIEKQRS